VREENGEREERVVVLGGERGGGTGGMGGRG